MENVVVDRDQAGVLPLVRLAVPVRPVVRRDADPRPVARHGDLSVAKVGVVLVVVDAQVLAKLRPVRFVPPIDAAVPLVAVVRPAPVPRRQEDGVAVGAHRPILAHAVVGVAPVHRVAELRPPALAGLARAVGHPLEDLAGARVGVLVRDGRRVGPLLARSKVRTLVGRREEARAVLAELPVIAHPTKVVIAHQHILLVHVHPLFLRLVPLVGVDAPPGTSVVKVEDACV